MLEQNSIVVENPDDNAEFLENEDNSVVSSEIVSCFAGVFLMKNQIGVAIYLENRAELLLGTIFSCKFEQVMAIINEYAPQVVITSSKSGQLINALKSGCQRVEVMKSVDFSYSSCKLRIVNLQIPFLNGVADIQERTLLLSPVIDLENESLVGAAGALALWLEKRTIENEKNRTNFFFVVNSIRPLSLNDIMILDQNTLSSLQIFKVDSHPSSHQIGRSKEGISLFSLLCYTQSPLGKSLLRQWFFNPSQKIALRIEKAYDFAVLFVFNEIEIIGLLKRFKDTSKLLSRIRINQLQTSLSDWKVLFDTLVSIIKIREICKVVDYRDLEILTKIVEIGETIDYVCETISSFINFNHSKAEKRLVLHEGLSPEVDELRELYNNLEQVLEEIGEEELQKYPSIQALRIMYIQSIGFELVIPIESDYEVAHVLKDFEALPNFQYQFHTDCSIYFKNQACLELDENIGDIHHKIIEKEAIIVQALTEEVLKYSSEIIEISSLIAEIDCLLSLTTAAEELHLTRPTMTEENVIYISNGRHLIQEICAPTTFIPNDTNIAFGRDGSIQLITGPNFSGKSIYLKQVGLITYMAHIGSFVPAEASLIGLTDRIMTRIHSHESVTLDKSSFMIDSQQVASMFSNATDRSLLLLDEFGKGTNKEDGVAIFAATMNTFLGFQNPPKMIVSTHFFEVFSMNLIPLDHPNLQVLTMDVMVSAKDGCEEVTFLYRLKEGYCTHSYGQYVAKIAGVPTEIIERSQYIGNCLAARIPIEPLKQDQELKKNEEIVDYFKNFDCDTGNISELIKFLSEGPSLIIREDIERDDDDM